MDKLQKENAALKAKISEVSELGMELCEILGFVAAALLDGKIGIALAEIKKTEEMNLEILIAAKSEDEQ